MSDTTNEPIRVESSIETRDLWKLSQQTGNLYEGIAIISRRANQISSTIKEELTHKLQEFASSSDNLEEVQENREQIEISRHYEKLPNPALRAFEEFMNDEIYYRYAEEGETSEDAK